MFYIIFILIVGSSCSSLLFKNYLNVWQSQGFWCQASIMVAFSWSFFENVKYKKPKNIPLGLIHLWVGIFVLYIQFFTQAQGAIEVKKFLSYFNFLCLLIMYNVIVQHLNRKDIEKILVGMKYVTLLTLGICVLQYVGLSQFFSIREGTTHAENNLVSGFLGNGTLLSGLLGFSTPLFLWKRTREDILGLILLILVLCTTGTTMKDPSATGFVVAIVIWLYYVKKNRYLFIGSICVLIGLAIAGFTWNQGSFFNSSGRLGYWRVYWKLFPQMPVTGMGPGGIGTIYLKTAVPRARHLHMEYFNFAFELGILGFFLILNLIVDFLKKRPKDSIEWTLKAIVIGFLVSCLMNDMAHLWIPTTWVMFSYAAFMALKGDKNGITQRNKN